MRAALLTACALAIAASLAAQSRAAFKARLSPVPIDLTMQATVAGNGSVTATLDGDKLTLTGSFEQLKSPATTAALHRSTVRGVRGPDVTPLSVTPATSGTITGSIELTPALLADLRGGRLYVQVHSEKAPDGTLWGWLLAGDKK
jgi:CHRD domain-containing protein